MLGELPVGVVPVQLVLSTNINLQVMKVDPVPVLTRSSFQAEAETASLPDLAAD
jgi:hypothetical protein